MDFLSFCPSLIDIFQIVEFEDIQNCNLVNRTFHNVIQKNSKSMPLYKRSLSIQMLTEETTATPYILINICVLKAMITPERTILIQHKKPMFEQCGLNGREGELVSELSEDDTTMKVIRDYFKVLEGYGPWMREFRKNDPNFNMEEEEKKLQISIQKTYDRVRIYKNDDMKDGLRTIWSYIFRNYHCINVELENSIPEEWIDVLSECGEGIHPRTVDLTVPAMSTALQRLVKSQKCRELWITSDEQDTFQSDVQEITSWNIGIKVERYLKEFESLQAFSLFLQKWCVGDW